MALSARVASYLTMAPRWRSPRATAAFASTAVSTPPPARARSPYEVLQVGESASAAEIRAAYRTMAKRAHPDGGLGRRPEVFLELRRAYETLSDPAARARYDASIVNHRVAPRAGRFGPARRRWETEQCW